MPFNPAIHHRRSIRLKGYDYSQAGLYFVTICVQNRSFLFGKIENGKMILNDAGKMVEKWYLELPNKFPDIELGEYVVMPNHFHAIIINTGNPIRPDKTDNVVVGADTQVCPYDEHILGEHISGEHTGSPLHAVVQWFKTMSTNEYIRGVKTLNWQPFNKKLWQRNYYEHIIRNEQSYQNISNYIINNPVKWENDKFYME
ncbi:MAG: transposase [Bacteroidales bacterium]|jgi:REP element-mobilizing transposase RayT|nr:transposase [Bacteroidales bacterium]